MDDDDFLGFDDFEEEDEEYANYFGIVDEDNFGFLNDSGSNIDE